MRTRMTTLLEAFVVLIWAAAIGFIILVSVAHAGPVAQGSPYTEEDFTVRKVIQGPNGLIVLFQNGQFKCAKNQHRVIMLVPATQMAFEGCWFLHDDKIDVNYEDGDTGSFPAKLIFGTEKAI